QRTAPLGRRRGLRGQLHRFPHRSETGIALSRYRSSRLRILFRVPLGGGVIFKALREIARLCHFGTSSKPQNTQSLTHCQRVAPLLPFFPFSRPSSSRARTSPSSPTSSKSTEGAVARVDRNRLAELGPAADRGRLSVFTASRYDGSRRG